MRAKPLPSIVLQALLLILFNLTLISAKGGGAGGGGGGAAGGAGTGGGRSGGSIGGGLGGGGGLGRNTGAIVALVIGVIGLLIIIIIVAVWHKSMVASYKRMDAAKSEPGKPVKSRATSAEADLEAAKPIFRDVPAGPTSSLEGQRPYAQVAAEEDAANAGKKKKKNYSMWKWMLF